MPHIFECYSYTPETPQLPADFAIAMGAPVASRVRDRRGNEASIGAYSADLAARLGATVVAYQDLGPKVSFPELRQARFRMRPDNFPEYAHDVGQALGAYLAKREVARSAFRIHSGNGPLGTQLALELAGRPPIEVTHLAVSDPVGMKVVPSTISGLRLWLGYKFGHERQTPAEQRPEAGLPANTIRALVSDIAVRGQIWRTATTLHNLRAIHESASAAVLLHLPEFTFNALTDDIQAFTEQFAERPNSAPFRAEFVPGSYHGSMYDSFTANAAFMQRALDLMPLTGDGNSGLAPTT